MFLLAETPARRACRNAAGVVPATVLMREEDVNTGAPKTYWVVHGTSLLRVAPEHLRPLVEHGGNTAPDMARAEAAARDIRARSTTQYHDLRATPPPPVSEDTDTEDEAGQDAPMPPAPARPSTAPAAPNYPARAARPPAAFGTCCASAWAR